MIILLTCKALNGMAPKYIADLLQPYTPTRQLRSSSNNLLVTPKSNLKFYGDRSFQFALYIFSLVNLSKSNSSYFLEINFYYYSFKIFLRF